MDSLYALATELPAVSAAAFNGIPVHPGEDASAKQETDWWRVVDKVLSATDAAYYIAGTPPPSMAALAHTDMTGYSEVTLPAKTAGRDYFAAVDHNRKVRAAVQENVRKQQAREGAQLRSAIALATALDTALRPNAMSLLTRLQTAHHNATESTRSI